MNSHEKKKIKKNKKIKRRNQRKRNKTHKGKTERFNELKYKQTKMEASFNSLPNLQGTTRRLHVEDREERRL